MRPRSWWQFGLFGAGVLLSCTFVKFVAAIPRVVQGPVPWDELIALPAQVFAFGFACGISVWLVRPLWRRYGTIGDVVTGALVIDTLFVGCMFVFDREMLLSNHGDAAAMIALGTLLGCFGGYITGRDLRADESSHHSPDDT